MPIYRVAVEFTAKSGIAADSVVNDFVLDDTGSPDPIADGPLVATAAIAELYNTAHAFPASADLALAYFMGASLSRDSLAVKVKYYDLTGHMDGSNTGSPTVTDAFTLGAHNAAATDLPAQIACCLTMRGAGWEGQAIDVPGGAPGPVGDTRPRQRYTGRIFLGPLTSGVLAQDGTTKRVSLYSGFRSLVLEAAQGMNTALNTGGYGLGVWSRKLETAHPVVRFEVDDRIDTQRRRVERATVRDHQDV